MTKWIQKYFVGILIILMAFLSGCEAFNLSMPEYINTYHNEAAVVRMDDQSPNFQIASDGNTRIIPPSVDTVLNLTLRNPKQYELHPVVYGWNGNEWDTGIVVSRVNAEQTKPDTISLTVFTPNIGDELKLRVTLLKNDGSSFQEFSDYPFDIPVLRCNDNPVKPQNVTINGIAEGGLKLSWVQSDHSDISDAVTLTIYSAQEGLGETVINRGNGGKWEGVGGSGTLADPYAVTLFSGITVTNTGLTMKFVNQDGLVTAVTKTADDNPTYTVSGKISKNDAGSLSGIKVQLKKDGNNAGSPVTTDSNGDYTVYGMLPGTYTAEVTSDWYTTGSIGSFVITSQNITGKNLTLNRIVYSISGTITTSDSAAPTGAVVQLKKAGANVYSPVTLGAAGTYSFSSIAAGENYTIEVTKANYNTGLIQAFLLNGNAANKNLKLERTTYTISGTITGTKDGITYSGLSGAKVELIQGGPTLQTVITASNGTYTIAGVLPGSNFSLYVTAAGYTYSRTLIFTVAGNITGKDVTLKWKYAVGDAGPAGGIIISDYMSNSNYTYLEAAKVNLGPVAWGLGSSIITNSSWSNSGYSKENTDIIIARLKASGESGKAAQVCVDYRGGGYSDWYLPTNNDMNLMYNNISKLSALNILGVKYWTSTWDTSSTNSRVYDMGTNQSSQVARTGAYYVKPVRRF